MLFSLFVVPLSWILITRGILTCNEISDFYEVPIYFVPIAVLLVTGVAHEESLVLLKDKIL